MAAVRDEARWAAAWWVSRLGSFHDPAGLGSGRPVTAADMETVAGLNAETARGGRFGAGERDAFGAELERGIEELIRRGPGQMVLPRDRVVVAVDWAPDDTLVRAAARAGLDLAVMDLPVKTMMVIRAGESVRVKQGYGQPWRQIWPRPGELAGDDGVPG